MRVSPQIQQLESKVLALRQRGYTSQEMSSELEEPLHRIQYVVQRLRKEGKIALRKNGYRSEFSRKKLDEQIILMRKAGLSNRQIAKACGKPCHVVATRVMKLIKTGEVVQRCGGRTAQPTSRTIKFWRHPESPLFQWFVKSFNARTPMHLMRRRLNCSTQRVLQLVRKLRKEYGDDLFAERDRILTVGEVSRLTGVPRKKIAEMCELGLIRHIRYGKKGYRFIPAAEVEHVTQIVKGDLY